MFQPKAFVSFAKLIFFHSGTIWNLSSSPVSIVTLVSSFPNWTVAFVISSLVFYFAISVLLVIQPSTKKVIKNWKCSTGQIVGTWVTYPRWDEYRKILTKSLVWSTSFHISKLILSPSLHVWSGVLHSSVILVISNWYGQALKVIWDAVEMSAPGLTTPSHLFCHKWWSPT